MEEKARLRQRFGLFSFYKLKLGDETELLPKYLSFTIINLTLNDLNWNYLCTSVGKISICTTTHSDFNTDIWIKFFLENQTYEIGNQVLYNKDLTKI